jgi:hypothetical protein
VAIVIVLLVVAVVGTVAVGGLDAEVWSEAPKSLGYRVQYWRSSWDMIREMPMVGCGPGNFQHRYMAYKLPEASEEIADPHNFVIEIWATAGSPALLALFGFCGAFAVCMIRSAKTSVRDLEAAGAKAREPAGERVDLWAIYVGAFVGMILSIPVGALSAAPTVLLVPLLGLLIGAAVLAVLQPWADHGEDSPWLWTCAAAVVLIHLLFAGGIAYPGVAGGLWLLLALALAVCACGDRPVTPRVGVVVLVGTIALIAACYLTGYQPTLGARLQVQRALVGTGDPRDRLRDAATADRWAFEPRKYLAELMHQRWLEQPSESTFQEFDRAVNETLDRAPHAATLHHLFGKAYCECFNRSHHSQHLAKGIALLETSVFLYPNSCRIRADLAEAYLLAGDQDGYERERDEALRLDGLTPHLDKKLSREQRELFLRNRVARKVRAATLE